MQILRFALRNLWRDLKSGELSVLLLALTVAVLSLTAVGFFTSRISQGVRAQAAEVLAADLRLESPQPIAPRYFTEAQAKGLRSARMLSFPTAIFSGDVSQLAALNAVFAATCASPTSLSESRARPTACRAGVRFGSTHASSPN
jgi:putative ABC transport system permease protein